MYKPLQIPSTLNLQVYDDPYEDFPNQNSGHLNHSEIVEQPNQSEHFEQSNLSEHSGQSNHSEHSDQSNHSDFNAVEIVTNPYYGTGALFTKLTYEFPVSFRNFI